jgi:orotate phosphoribosyltransferase
VTAAAFRDLVSGRRGLFRLESGHHGELWLDLDPLFAQPRRIEPFVAGLSRAIRPHGVQAVCGPLLGGAFLAQLVARALEAEFAFTERVMPSEPAGLYSARYRLPAAFIGRVSGSSRSSVGCGRCRHRWIRSGSRSPRREARAAEGHGR